MAEPHVLGKTAYSPSSENTLHLAFSALFVLEAGRFGLREVRVPGHERADPESWVELYKWGQDSGTGHFTAEHPSPPTPIPLFLWWGLWGFGISLLCPVVFFSGWLAEQCYVFISPYRRPKIGLEAVSMSCSSTSPVSGNCRT